MGFLIGAAPTIGNLLGYAAFGYGLYQWATAPDTVEPMIDDLKLQKASYGTLIPRIIGRERVGGLVFWSTDLIPKEHEESAKGGPSIITYTYRASFAVKFAQGEVVGIPRIWFDTSLVYDVSDKGGKKSMVASVEGGLDFEVYLGKADQMPDPTIESYKGVGETSAHRGYVYIVFKNLLLTKWGNKIPNVSAELQTHGTLDNYTGKLIELEKTLPDGIATYAYNVWEGEDLVTTWYGTKNDGTGGITGLAIQRWDIESDTPNTAIFYQHLATSVPPSSSGVQHQIVSHIPGELVYWDTFGGLNDIFVYPSGTRLSAGTGDQGLYSNALRVGQDFYYCIHNPDATIAAAVNLRYEKDNGFGQLVPVAGIDFDAFPDSLKELSLYGHDTANYIAVARFAFTTFVGGHHVSYVDRASLEVVGKFQIPAAFVTILGVAEDILYVFMADGNLHGYSIPDGDLVWNVPVVDSTGAGGTQSRTNHMITPNLAQVGETIWFLGGAQASTLVPLSEMIETVCGWVNISPGQLDVADVAGTMTEGLVVSKQQTAERVLQDIAAAYLLDAVEPGPALTFKRGGKAPVWTMDDDNILDDVEITEQQEYELPAQVVIDYHDKEADFQKGSQYYNRFSTLATGKKGISVPIVLGDDQAAQVAEITGQVAWRGAKKFKWKAHLVDFETIAPADGVTLTTDGRTFEVKVTAVGFELPGSIALEGQEDGQDAWVSYAKGGKTGDRQVVPGAAQTRFLVADAPALVIEHDYPGVYVFAWGTTNAWSGCSIMRSDDQGQNWQLVRDIVSQAKVGVCQTIPDDWYKGVVQEGGYFDVFMPKQQALQATDRAGLYAGLTSVLVGQEGRWEVISYEEVTDLGNGLQRLSKLIRGRLGTEQFVGTHQIGDWVVVLDGQGFQRVKTDPGNLGNEFWLAAVPSGGTIDNAIISVITPRDMGVKPYAPVHLRLWWDAAKTQWLLEWKRRARIRGEWNDYVDVPLRDVPESYIIRILRPGSPVIELTSNVPGVWIPEVLPGDIIGVQQVSPDVGEGYTATLTI